MIFKRQRRRVRLHRYQLGMRKLAQFAAQEKERKCLFSQVNRYALERTLNVTVRHVLLTNRERAKERRARRVWEVRRRKRSLLWGLQALEMQAARRWAQRENTRVTVDQYRRRRLLKIGLKFLISAREERSLIDATYKAPAPAPRRVD
jgi:hypothetical protein